jgi:hypothetical protein
VVVVVVVLLLQDDLCLMIFNGNELTTTNVAKINIKNISLRKRKMK